MDAAAILGIFRKCHAPLTAELKVGPVVAPVTIHKANAYGIVFSGQCVAPVNDPVTVILRDLKAEGIISSRTDRRSALLFVRPAQNWS
ncbi:hypothetical protein [Sphingobium sp. Leaf26]|uniref:hypothetical protein n=1 Tax=Sphingobium sp. Leaf26 TaxID=1735693 RepID=UPI000AE888C8|nr:hypothetical protein [Sphingobium sp. Leaf26]